MNRCSLRVTPKEQEGRAEEHSLFCRICWKNTFDLLTNPRFCAMIRNGLRDRSIWAHSSAGRAPRSQCGGPPLIDGGGQQRGRRSGTLNVPGIVGFGAAARLADPARFSSCARDRFEELLAASGLPFELIAADRPRLPGTSLVSLPGEDAGKLVDALYAAGVAASAGSACSGRGSEPSRLLLDLGYPALTAAGAVRFSFGAESSIAEAEEAAAVFIRIIQATNRKGVVDVNAYR